jgi:hypothetical protein
MFYAAQDVIEYLMNTTGGGAQDNEHRVLRAALHHGYRDLMNSRDWLWHVSESSVTIQNGVGSYDLPPDIRNIDSLIPERRSGVAAFVTPQEFQYLEVNNTTIGTPVYWTIVRDENATDFDKWQIRVAGRPGADLKLYFTYRRTPKPISLMGFESQCRVGTVTAMGTTVAGAGTAFPPLCAGSIIRFGTPDVGPEPLTGTHPYQEQQRIASCGGADSLTLVSPVSRTYTSVKYSISDYIDMSPTMYTALLSAAEMWLARLAGRSVDAAAAVYERDLRFAFEADTIAPMSGRRTPVGWGPRMSGWDAPAQPDTGV